MENDLDDWPSSEIIRKQIKQEKLRAKYKILIEKSKVGYYGYYYLIVPDHASGRKNRYTVYRVPSSPAHRIIIVGREFPLGFAKKLVNKINKK